MSDPLDEVERFRLLTAKSVAATAPSPKSVKMKTWFLKGPIPLPWLQVASSLPGRALHVGLAIWFLSGLQRCKEVRLTHRTLRRFSVPADAYRRGLKQLEEAGLVRVIRKPGQCSLITLLDVPAVDESGDREQSPKSD